MLGQKEKNEFLLGDVGTPQLNRRQSQGLVDGQSMAARLDELEAMGPAQQVQSARYSVPGRGGSMIIGDAETGSGHGRPTS